MTKSERYPDSLVAGELARQLRTKAATEKKNACHYSATLLERSARLLETYGCPGGVKLTIEQAELIVGLLKSVCVLDRSPSQSASQGQKIASSTLAQRSDLAGGGTLQPAQRLLVTGHLSPGSGLKMPPTGYRLIPCQFQNSYDY